MTSTKKGPQSVTTTDPGSLRDKQIGIQRDNSNVLLLHPQCWPSINNEFIRGRDAVRGNDILAGVSPGNDRLHMHLF